MYLNPSFQGLALARGSVIVRLDADDVCAPQRISRQLSALTAAGPHLAAIGGAVTLFTEEADHVEDENESSSDERVIDDATNKTEHVSNNINASSTCTDSAISNDRDAAAAAATSSALTPNRKPPWRSLRRTVVHPSEPLLVQWGLWWSCCVAHPAVTMRRHYDIASTSTTATATATAGAAAAATASAAGAGTADSSAAAPSPVATSSLANDTSTSTAEQAVPPQRRQVRVAYRPSAEGAEDYDLWFRLSAATGGVANLPSVVTHHRRHAKNATVTFRLSPESAQGATMIPGDTAAAASAATTAASEPTMGKEIHAEGRFTAAGSDVGVDLRSGTKCSSSEQSSSSYDDGSILSEEEEVDDNGPKILSPAEAAAEWVAGTEDPTTAATLNATTAAPALSVADTATAAAETVTAASATATATIQRGPLAERGKSAALRVATAHMTAALSRTSMAAAAAADQMKSSVERKEGKKVSLRAAACARDPSGAAAWGATPKDFMDAANLMLDLEKATLRAHSAAAGAGEGAAAAAAVQPPFAYESPWARSVVTADCTARIGELALAAMATHGSDTSQVWEMWAKRAGPEAQVAALRGLLGSGK